MDKSAQSAFSGVAIGAHLFFSTATRFTVFDFSERASDEPFIFGAENEYCTDWRRPKKVSTRCPEKGDASAGMKRRGMRERRGQWPRDNWRLVVFTCPSPRDAHDARTIDGCNRAPSVNNKNARFSHLPIVRFSARCFASPHSTQRVH